MQKDTELGIFTEAKAVAHKLRKDLWGLHTRSLQKDSTDELSRSANPEDMHNPKVAKAVFEIWEKIMRDNKDQIINGQKPLYPLCEFLRFDPDISRLD